MGPNGSGPLAVNAINNTRISMKSITKCLTAICVAAFACAASAAPRSSADYSIAMESIDQGGATLASADYSMNASVNDSGSIASEATTGYLAKGGYIGQLFNVTGVIPSAPASTVNEGLTLQLGAAQLLDDTTLLPFSASLATWSIVGNPSPLASINTSGLATAATVYQNTLATVQASYQGLSGTLNLTVLNVNTDDYGSYAGDGLPDDWQVQYFGLNNPNAAPTKDASGTGQTNLFKYIAGLNPTDHSSVFRVSVQPVAGQPSRKQILFSPVISNHTYAVYCKTNLTDSTWTLLTGATQSDSGQQRTVTDTNATGTTKFYKVQISKP